MFKLDNAFLEELGLGSLPPVEKNKMLAHIYETLEMRVGVKLAEQMSNEQLDEFEGYINKKDEAGALKWLESNFPNYKQVVAEELDKLKAEISQVAPQIVAQSVANAQQNPAPVRVAPAQAQPQNQMPQQAQQQPQYSNPPQQPQPSPVQSQQPVQPSQQPQSQYSSSPAPNPMLNPQPQQPPQPTQQQPYQDPSQTSQGQTQPYPQPQQPPTNS